MAKNAYLNLSEGLVETVTGKKPEPVKEFNELFFQWKEYLDVTWNHKQEAVNRIF